MKKSLLFISMMLFGGASVAYAILPPLPKSSSDHEVMSMFRQFKNLAMVPIKVPTVVEVPFSESVSNRYDFAVFDVGAAAFQPYLFIERRQTNQPMSSMNVSDGRIARMEMLDGDASTFADFVLPETGQGQTRLVLTSSKSITLNKITLLLDQYVALPTSIEVRAVAESGEKIVLARSRMQGTTVVFPKTSAREWNISLTYGQPLRISELVLNDEDGEVSSIRVLRFLAQPNHSYRIYFDADRSVLMRVGEVGNLFSDADVMHLATIPAQSNTGYVLADTDGDGVPDIRDNCVSTTNSDQVDVNENGRGDVCDDFDKDGVMNMADNCPNDPNYNQADADGDKIGDICDTEESRVTEKYPWLPWVGMGFAGSVLIVLFALTARGMIKNDSAVKENQE